MRREYQTFQEFYPFYLEEHKLPITKLFHFFGSLAVLTVIIMSFILGVHILLLAPIFGYGMAWFSHYFFEKNRPATFKYPLYSFLGDWVMFYEIWRGRHRIF
jgi:hypothetical protein